MALQDGTEKRTKDTYGPPMGKRLMIFLDDLNMPRMDQYGTQQPIALLKLLIDRKVRISMKRCLAGSVLPVNAVTVVSPAPDHDQQLTRSACVSLCECRFYCIRIELLGKCTRHLGEIDSLLPAAQLDMLHVCHVMIHKLLCSAYKMSLSFLTQQKACRASTTAARS